MGSTRPGHTPGKVNATCLLLSSASQHCPGCLTSARGGEWGFTAGSPLGSSLSVLLSSTLTTRKVPPCPRPGVLEGVSALLILQTQTCTVPDQGCSSHPFLPMAQLQVPNLGTAPSHQFHQGFTTATREVAPPHSSSICSAGGSTTETQPATPPLTSGGEVAAGCGFALPSRLLPGTVSMSWDDSKPGRRSLCRCLFYFKPSCLESGCCGSAPLGVLCKGGGIAR